MTKKKNFILLFILCLPTTFYPLDIQKTIKYVFGPTGTELSLVSYHFIEDLFSELMHTTAYEQMAACTKAAAALSKEIEHKEIELTTASYDAQTVSQTLH